MKPTDFSKEQGLKRAIEIATKIAEAHDVSLDF
jgi:hypothetical protein